MRVLSVTLFALVIFILNESGDAIIDKIKKGAEGIVNKGAAAVQKLSDEVIAKGVDFFCEHSGEFGEFGAKGFGFLKCDEDHKAKDYCKFVDDGKMMYQMICCLGEEQRKEAFGNAIKCFQTKDQHDGQDCLERWGKWIMSLKEVGELLVNQAKGGK